MKSTPALEKIIREELAKVQQERLTEYYTETRVEPGFQPKKPWTNTKFESALRALGAKPFSNGLNPHGYELDVTGGAKGKGDRLWFYYNGEVWSTNQTRTMGYTTNKKIPGAITLWTQPGVEQLPENELGEIKKIGGKAVFQLASEKNAAVRKEKEQSSSALDTFQTVLDWAGMVPVIGDAIDIINGAIYFARGKWFDGILSMIAVIPVVGSAIKMSVKAIYRGAKLDKLVRAIGKSFNKSKGADELWEMLVKDGAITRDQLQYVGKGLESLENVLGKARPAIKTLPGGDVVLKELDDFSDWMKQSEKSIRELSAAGVKGAEKVAQSTGQLAKGLSAASVKAGTATKLVQKISDVTSKKMFNRVRRLSSFPEKKLLQLAKAVELRFAREMSNPNRLTAIVKTSDPMILRKIIDDPKRVRQLESLNSKALQRYFDVIRKQNPERFKTLASRITDYAKRNDNIIWSMYKTDNVKNVRSLVSKDMITAGLYKNLDLSMRKNADIIYNEVSDLGDELGVTPDNPNGVVMPIILGGLNQVLPGKKTVQDYVKDIKTNPAVATALETAGYVQNKQTGEIEKKSELAYDPTKTSTGSQAGGKYK